MNPTQKAVYLYERTDRERFMQIACDTAYFGAPIEAYIEDRKLFADVFYSYYPDYEPSHCWVASVDDHMVGFLCGCVNTMTYNKIMLGHYIPTVLRKYFHGEYQVGPKTKQYVWRLARSWLKGEFYAASKKRFPAHLHINILAQWRGQGLGRPLMKAYLAQLRSLGIRGVHLHTTNQNVAACRLYERTGFQLLKAKKSSVWQGMIDLPVENRCYGLDLRREEPA